jgi:hypothetical protein
MNTVRSSNTSLKWQPTKSWRFKKKIWAGFSRLRGSSEIRPSFCASRRLPGRRDDRMKMLTLADCFMATLAIGIVIGFPIWQWISKML